MEIVTRGGQNGSDESDSGGIGWIMFFVCLFALLLLKRNYNRMVKFMDSEAKFLRSFSFFTHVLIYNKHLTSNSISHLPAENPTCENQLSALVILPFYSLKAIALSVPPMVFLLKPSLTWVQWPYCDTNI